MKENKKIFNFGNSSLLHFKKNFIKKFNWKVFATYVFYSFICLIFLTVLLFAWFAKDLPTPSKIANRRPAESTKLYDRTGKTLLYETGDQKRTVIASDQMSPYLKDATVATEDANFYNHNGFDSKAIAQAMLEKLTGKRIKTRGGSTITQQYVKNALLSSDRSMIRKVKELILSIELEFMFNKDEILTMYLNEIPYGNSTAGAEAASKMYFGIPAKDLTLAEAAMLAAIPQAPTYYSPYGTHTKELASRKNYVLNRMVETKKITEEQANLAKKDDILTLGATLKPRRDVMLAPHFAMYVIEQVAEQYGEEKIQKEGLKIITTIDIDKQKIAEDAVNADPDKYARANASNAALAAIDPKTGQILAMVGSRDYWNISIDGNVNVADSLRQPGSSFKPIVYATAFKKSDFSPSKNIFDLQTDFGNGYVPRNYSGTFSGPVTVRHALANSLNIPAVKTTSLAGIDNIIRTAEDFGITTLNDRNRYGLSFGLGVAEVKPVEIAGAFGVFATGGIKHDIKSVIKISDSKGKTIYEYNNEKDSGKKVLDPQIAYEISDILKDNNARTPMFGARSSLFFSGREVAAKTGTTSENKDSWTIGYTPSIAVAVWVGNNKPTPMTAGGVMLAAPIFHSFVEKSLANTANEPFVQPEGIKKVVVERFSNKLPSDSSSGLVEDIFASWQAPTEKDNVNIKVKICKGTNKLAPDNLEAGLVEERTYTNLHSERPDNPNWERPVRAWAEGAGISNLPPTEYCNAKELTSTISIVSPENNSTVTGVKEITVSVASPSNITNVEFFIDDVSIGSTNTSPYSKTYDFNNLSEGIHRVSAILTNDLGGTARSEIKVNVSKAGTTLSISEIKSENLSNILTKITWSTSLPATSQVAYRKDGENSYSATTAEVELKNSHSVSIPVLPNTKYFYRVISKDANNNSVSSTEKTFTSAS